MTETTSEKQSLIDGFLNETAPEGQRIANLKKLSELDEEIAIELINKTFKKNPTVSLSVEMANVLPGMNNENAYELAKKYTAYLLKYDIERLPKHSELLQATLPILTKFNRAESADLIINAYSRFRNEKHEQKAVLNSGAFEILLNENITEQQRYEILLILGDYNKITSLPKNAAYDAACRKIVKMHSDTKRIKSDLEYLKERGDMELYKEILEKVRMKLVPEVLVKAAYIGGIAVLIAFVAFFFLFIFNKGLPYNEIANRITGFGISAFCIFVIVGTFVLFKFKNR